jgi:hypothetical protein
MYSIAAVEFANENDAREALKGLSETPKINGTTIFQIALVKRQNGELKLCDNFTSEYLTDSDTAKGGLIGGLIGLLGGVAGALLGDAKDVDKKHFSQELITQVAQRMEDGDMGLLMTVDETDESILDHMLVKYNNKNVYRFDAEAIAKEVEAAKEEAEQKDD